MIAALFVATGGTYFGLEGVDPWDEKRDARKYAGPHPVVAHPPCARWCRLAGLVEKRWGHKKGEDGGIFASALNSVRTWGGVLEHPAYSDAWAKFLLPAPPQFWRMGARHLRRLELPHRAMEIRPPSEEGHMALRFRRRATAVAAMGRDARQRRDRIRPRRRRRLQAAEGEARTRVVVRKPCERWRKTPAPWRQGGVGNSGRIPRRVAFNGAASPAASRQEWRARRRRFIARPTLCDPPEFRDILLTMARTAKGES